MTAFPNLRVFMDELIVQGPRFVYCWTPHRTRDQVVPATLSA